MFSSFNIILRCILILKNKALHLKNTGLFHFHPTQSTRNAIRNARDATWSTPDATWNVPTAIRNAWDGTWSNRNGTRNTRNAIRSTWNAIRNVPTPVQVFRPPSERSDPGRNDVFAYLYMLQSTYLQQFEPNSASKAKIN